MRFLFSTCGTHAPRPHKLGHPAMHTRNPFMHQRAHDARRSARTRTDLDVDRKRDRVRGETKLSARNCSENQAGRAGGTFGAVRERLEAPARSHRSGTTPEPNRRMT